MLVKEVILKKYNDQSTATFFLILLPLNLTNNNFPLGLKPLKLALLLKLRMHLMHKLLKAITNIKRRLRTNLNKGNIKLSSKTLPFPRRHRSIIC